MNEIQALAFVKTITDIYYLVSILFLLFLPIGTIISIYGLSRPRHSTSTIVMLFMSLPVIILMQTKKNFLKHTKDMYEKQKMGL